jgi:hypothetical protein
MTYTVEQANALTSAQINALTTAQIQSLSPSAFAAINGANAYGFTAAQVAKFSLAQIAAIGTGANRWWLGNLSVSALSGLTAEQISALAISSAVNGGPSGLNGLSTVQLQALTNNAISGITKDQIKSLSALQLQVFLNKSNISLSDITTTNSNVVVNGNNDDFTFTQTGKTIAISGNNNLLKIATKNTVNVNLEGGDAFSNSISINSSGSDTININSATWVSLSGTTHDGNVINVNAHGVVAGSSGGNVVNFNSGSHDTVANLGGGYNTANVYANNLTISNSLNSTYNILVDNINFSMAWSYKDTINVTKTGVNLDIYNNSANSGLVVMDKANATLTYSSHKYGGTVNIRQAGDVLYLNNNSNTVGINVNVANAWFTKNSAGDLKISSFGPSGSSFNLVIKSWESNLSNSIQSADGKIANHAGIEKLIQAMSSYAVPSGSSILPTAEQTVISAVIAANFH